MATTTIALATPPTTTTENEISSKSNDDDNFCKQKNILITWSQRVLMFFDDLNDIVVFLFFLLEHVIAISTIGIKSKNKEDDPKEPSAPTRPTTIHLLEHSSVPTTTSTAKTSSARQDKTAIIGRSLIPIPQNKNKNTFKPSQITLVSTLNETALKCDCKTDCTQSRYCVCKRNNRKCNELCH